MKEEHKRYNLKNIEILNSRPHIHYENNNKELSVRLSESVLNDNKIKFSNFYFEFIHEGVHLLSPGTDKQFFYQEQYYTNYLEERIATYISLEGLKKFTILKQYDKYYSNIKGKNDKYFKALNLINEILKQKPNFISDIRGHNLFFTDLNAEHFYKIGYNNDKIINLLLQPFYKDIS